MTCSTYTSLLLFRGHSNTSRKPENGKMLGLSGRIIFSVQGLVPFPTPRRVVQRLRKLTCLVETGRGELLSRPRSVISRRHHPIRTLLTCSSGYNRCVVGALLGYMRAGLYTELLSISCARGPFGPLVVQTQTHSDPRSWPHIRKVAQRRKENRLLQTSTQKGVHEQQIIAASRKPRKVEF